MTELYGIMAEFEDAQDLVTAVHQVKAAGYRRFDAYTPFPIDEIADSLDVKRSYLWVLVAIGGVVGAVAGYGLQYYMHVINYPMNIGGRPFHSVPAFLLITFQLAFLGAALAGVLGMFVLNRLPMPYHPVFNVPGFREASRNSFFLCIEAADARFDKEWTRQFLTELDAIRVVDVDA